MARSNVRARSAQVAALLAAAILCAAAPAAAEVRVTDDGAGRLTIEAHDASVQQILDALGQSRTVRSETSEALSRTITGTYTGTLPRLMSRILDGYDHVIRYTSSGIELDIVGAAPARKIAAPVAAARPATTVPVAAATPASVDPNDPDGELAAGRRNAEFTERILNLASGPQSGSVVNRP